MCVCASGSLLLTRAYLLLFVFGWLPGDATALALMVTPRLWDAAAAWTLLMTGVAARHAQASLATLTAPQGPPHSTAASCLRSRARRDDEAQPAAWTTAHRCTAAAAVVVCASVVLLLVGAVRRHRQPGGVRALV